MTVNMDLHEANEIFHDWESENYEAKWGILYDEENSLRVRKKFEKLLRGPFPRVGKLLEIGCGTGYLGLNLCLDRSLVGEYYACDISQGMVERCKENAARLGIPAQVKKCGAEALDFPDCEFDMVIGHAILHHIPDLWKALLEVKRVLAPGGIGMFAGEPTVVGDALGRGARKLTTRFLNFYVKHGGYFWGSPARFRDSKNGEAGEDAAVQSLEYVVDVHTFWPPRVVKLARSLGFVEARYEGEELLSSFVGWCTRTIEGSLAEENLTKEWRFWAYNTYQKLSAIDERLYPFLPSWLFYNMLLYIKKPSWESGVS